MTLGPFEEHAGDLAPGDVSVLDADWSGFSLESIRSPASPSFEEAYERLWREFGERGEMERREVIEDRLAWEPSQPVAGHGFLYEMIVIRREGRLVAVRDHTAITSPASGSVFVHLSHVLVDPSMRGRGLAAWLRALPLTTAQKSGTGPFPETGTGPFQKRRSSPWLAPRKGPVPVSSAKGPVPDSRKGPVPDFTLVAEMEHGDAGDRAGMTRLRSYARAGFRVVDPRVTPYAQPDFRDPVDIDRSGLRPVPLSLVLRRVGRESETTMKGAELRSLVTALHAMFGVHVRPDHMAPVLALLDGFPSADEDVALLPPDSMISPQGADR